MEWSLAFDVYHVVFLLAPMRDQATYTQYDTGTYLCVFGDSTPLGRHILPSSVDRGKNHIHTVLWFVLCVILFSFSGQTVLG